MYKCNKIFTEVLTSAYGANSVFTATRDIGIVHLVEKSIVITALHIARCAFLNFIKHVLRKSRKMLQNSWKF